MKNEERKTKNKNLNRKTKNKQRKTKNENENEIRKNCKIVSECGWACVSEFVNVWVYECVIVWVCKCVSEWMFEWFLHYDLDVNCWWNIVTDKDDENCEWRKLAEENRAIIKFKKLYNYFDLAKRFSCQKTPPGIMFFNQLKTQDVLNKIMLSMQTGVGIHRKV